MHIHRIFDCKSKLNAINNLCSKYYWHMGINKTEADFIISDNPAFQFQNFECQELCIPISTKKAIFLIRKDLKVGLHDYPDKNGIINLSYDNVLYQNGIQIGAGYKYIFGDKKSICCGIEMFHLLEKRSISSNLIAGINPLKTVFYYDEENPLHVIAIVTQYEKSDNPKKLMEIVTSDWLRVYDEDSGELINCKEYLKVSLVPLKVSLVRGQFPIYIGKIGAVTRLKQEYNIVI